LSKGSRQKSTPTRLCNFELADEREDKNLKAKSMQYPFGSLPVLARHKGVAAAILLGVHFATAWPAGAALVSGIYQTLPGASVEERGDQVPNGSRVVPFFATLTFDLAAAQPSLTAVIPNAVLEGGDPFALTVRSSAGAQLIDGTYRFTGDYLQDITATGTQYLFDWQFSTASDGSIAWNGNNYWAGGHIWIVTISDIPIVPEPGTPTLIWVGICSLLAFRTHQRRNSNFSQAPR
jgi:hypothetical protein